MQIEEQILDLVKKANPANPVAFVDNIVREYAVEKLNEHIIECQDCEIRSSCNRKTIAYGNPNASVMLIGESMTEEQYNDGDEHYPFYGESGEVLSKVFEYLKVNTEQLFCINAVNCWPHRDEAGTAKKRAPHKQEVQNCQVFVDYAIDTVKPLVVILLGSIAMNLYVKDSITKARGNWIEVRGIPAMPTYHPGYFHEIEGKKDEDVIDALKGEFLDDLERAFRYIQENYPEVNIFVE